MILEGEPAAEADEKLVAKYSAAAGFSTSFGLAVRTRRRAGHRAFRQEKGDRACSSEDSIKEYAKV